MQEEANWVEQMEIKYGDPEIVVEPRKVHAQYELEAVVDYAQTT